MKNSPIPWKALKHYSAGVYNGQVIADAEGWGVCNIWFSDCVHDKPPLEIERCEANANLIVAASEAIGIIREFLAAERGESVSEALGLAVERAKNFLSHLEEEIWT